MDLFDHIQLSVRPWILPFLGSQVHTSGSQPPSLRIVVVEKYAHSIVTRSVQMPSTSPKRRSKSRSNSRSNSRAASRSNSRATSPVLPEESKIADVSRAVSKCQLSHRIMGEEDNPLMVFLAGFPDHETSAFDALISHFSSKYKVISCCLPGMGDSKESRDPTTVGWGFKFSEICEMLHSIIEKNVSSKDEKIILVGHDWGAYIASIYENLYPHRVSKIILYDVAMFKDSKSKNRGIKDLLVTFIYQGWWALSFLISRIYVPLGNIVFILYFALLRFFPILFYFICPTKKGDRMPRSVKEVTVSMTWPYYSLFRHCLFDKTMVPRMPSCPILFVYGKNKNIMFHNCLDELLHREDCVARGLLCGHWVMVEKSTMCIDIMEEYLLADKYSQCD